MSKRRFLLFALLMVALPSGLHAVGMGGMGGMMGAMVDEVNIRTKDVGTVLFSHSRHGADCGSCHPKIFKQKNNSNHVGMQAMEEGKSCGACHNGKTAFTVTANCAVCHAGDILYTEEDAGNVTFSHTAHLGMFGCGECHPDLFTARRGANKATMADMEEGKSCGACHDGSSAFSVKEDCEACHRM